MNTKTTVVLLLTLSIAATALAFTPTGAAHYCRGLNPFDCGPCTTGSHDHTWCYSSGDQLEILTDAAGSSQVYLLA